MQGRAAQNALPLQAVERSGHRQPGAADRGGTGAGIGLQDVAVHQQGAFPEGRQIEAGPQAATDQTLNLLGAAGELHQLARLAAGGGGRQQPVLGAEPTAAGTPPPAGHLLLEADAAEHAGAPGLDRQRTERKAHRIPEHTHRPLLIGTAAIPTAAAGVGTSRWGLARGGAGLRKRLWNRRNGRDHGSRPAGCRQPRPRRWYVCLRHRWCAHPIPAATFRCSGTPAAFPGAALPAARRGRFGVCSSIQRRRHPSGFHPRLRLLPR